MSTASLLQNTPAAVTMLRSNFLSQQHTKRGNAPIGTRNEKALKGMNPAQSTSLILSEQNSYALSQKSIADIRQNYSPTNVKPFLEDQVANRIGLQRISNRPKPRVIYKNTESSDEDENVQFQANPSEDIPRNKLTQKLVDGLQSYIQRMQQRENFRIKVTKPFDDKWQPAPRECATLTSVGYTMYMIGGLNFDTCKDIISAKINGGSVIWERVPYTS